MTAVDDRPAPEIGRAQAQGGPAPDHRSHPLDRQHPAARHAAPCHGAQPVRPREHHRHRHHPAKAAPGVLGVFTGSDLADGLGVVANAWPLNDEQKAPAHLPVAVDHVACAGEIVAVVAARSAAAARDAAELVDVDYDELPAVLDAREALDDEVLAHPDLGTNKSAFWQLDSAAAGHRG